MLVWFPDDVECADYLEWLRWPCGFICPWCASSGWKTAKGNWVCGGCQRRVSLTSGTVFEGTRLPLKTWFATAWHRTHTKTAGMSAKGLKCELELGSYQTAWTILHKFRSAMVRPGSRELLVGDVEVDETLVGGSKAGPPGRGAVGKTLVVIAVETLIPKGFGRARLKVIPDASGETLTRFAIEAIEPGATVYTDGWRAYGGLAEEGYRHVRFNLSASEEKAHVLLPAVHRVASLFKRSLLNSYQQYPKLHLQSYCDEWVFRFNRRHSRARGMLFFRLLELAVQAKPLPYKDLIHSRRSRRIPPIHPRRGSSPKKIQINVVNRPWRSA